MKKNNYRLENGNYKLIFDKEKTALLCYNEINNTKIDNELDNTKSI